MRSLSLRRLFSKRRRDSLEHQITGRKQGVNHLIKRDYVRNEQLTHAERKNRLKRHFREEAVARIRSESDRRFRVSPTHWRAYACVDTGAGVRSGGAAESVGIMRGARMPGDSSELDARRAAASFSSRHRQSRAKKNVSCGPCVLEGVCTTFAEFQAHIFT